MLLTNWHFMRWLRLGLSLFIAIQAIIYMDFVMGLASAFFLFQVVTNTGCCGANNCTVPYEDDKKNNIDDINYEEVKSK